MSRRRAVPLLRRPSMPTLLPAMLALLASVGCGGKPAAPQGGGDLFLVDPATSAHGRTMAVDFGPVAIGTMAERQIVLVNDGTSDVRIAPGELDGHVGFGVSAESGYALPPGGTQTLRLTFDPIQPGAAQASFSLGAEDPELAAVTLTMTAQGVSGACSVQPKTLDFGTLEVNRADNATAHVMNGSAAGWTVDVIGIDAVDGSGVAFSLQEGFAGRHTVPAHGEVLIPIAFRPHSAGAFEATLKLGSSVGCAGELAVVGRAVSDLVECPSMIEATDAAGQTVVTCGFDAGLMLPGSVAHGTLLMKNLGRTPMRLSNLRLESTGSAPSPFTLEDATATTLPGDGTSVAIPIAFAPTSTGQFVARLAYDLGSPANRTGFALVTGIGGGARLEATPAAVDFDVVAVGVGARRSIALTNAGLEVVGTTLANLRFGTAAADGTWTEQPPEIVGPGASAFSIVAWPPTGYAESSGLAVGASVALQVEVDAAGAGALEATLRVSTNDPTAPTVEIPLTASATAP